MPLVLFREYFEAITAIEAQEMLMQFQVSAFPHIKKEARTKIHKEITTLANPKVVDKDEAEVTMESIVKSLGGRRIPPRGK